jgi:hypothetical protein
LKELEISPGFYTKTGRNNDKRVKQANAAAQKKFKEIHSTGKIGGRGKIEGE